MMQCKNKHNFCRYIDTHKYKQLSSKHILQSSITCMQGTCRLNLQYTCKPILRNFSLFVFLVFFRNFSSLLIGIGILFLSSDSLFKSLVSTNDGAITLVIVDSKQRSKVLQIKYTVPKIIQILCQKLVIFTSILSAVENSIVPSSSSVFKVSTRDIPTALFRQSSIELEQELFSCHPIEL